MLQQDQTVEFIRRFWAAASSQKNCVRLVFENTKVIRPGAMLLLLAHIHKARLVYGNEHVTGTYPSNPRVERTFEESGFFKLLGVHPRRNYKKRHRPSTKYIPFSSGTVLVNDASRKLREALFGSELQMVIAAKKRLYRAVSEAMLNVVQHAYPGYFQAKQGARGRWWLAGSIDRRRDELLIMFCDLGIGIPRTLPKLYAIEKIRAALSLLPGIEPNDGEMIKAGMTIGRSQTMEFNRGKGLNDLRRFVEFSPGGELRILSRKGTYVSSSDGKESVKNSSLSIGGTLIKWTVPLSIVTNWNPKDFQDDELSDD